MTPARTWLVAAAASAMMLAASGSAHAECKGSQAIDNCLVGSWQQTGGGATEWMREHMKGAPINVTATKATITLSADGTFSTSKVDATAEVMHEGMPQVTSHVSSQGSGQWSAAEGKLTLCMGAMDGEGTIEMKGPGGKTTSMPMPQMQPTDVTMTYECAGTSLSTVQPMPMNSTMTTTYARVK
ncbi:MAG: hypothetical protein R3D30_13790 [Hyphomicrobiales bacterium]